MIVKQPYCSRCKGVTNIMPSPYTKKRNGDGSIRQYYMCRGCNALRNKKYRATDSGSVAIRKAIRKSTVKYPLKKKARTALNNAVKSGILTRPSTCSTCKQKKQVHGHHTDYNLPLEVLWVCRQCHADLHRTMIS